MVEETKKSCEQSHYFNGYFNGLEAIPFIGIYQKEDYRMMGKLFFKAVEGVFPKSDCNFLPMTLRKCLEKLEWKENNGFSKFKSKILAVQYYDGMILKFCDENIQKNAMCRLNYVMHALLFAQKTSHHEEKKFMFAGLFPTDVYEFGVSECKKEFQHLCFNLEDVDDKAAIFEVYVHKDDKGNWLFSPNNAAFQVCLVEPITNFYILNIISDNVGDLHLILSLNTIIWQEECDLIKNNMLSSFYSGSSQSKSEDLFENFLSTLLINTMDLVEKFIQSFTESPSEQQENIIKKFISFISNAFSCEESQVLITIYKFIHHKFENTKVNSFGHDILELCSLQLKKNILFNYLKSYIQSYLHSLCVQCFVLNINCDMIIQQIQSINQKFLTVMEKEIPERKIVHEIVEFVIAKEIQNIEKWMKEKIINPFECWIYEKTWIYKGKIQGISGEFGRYSFLNNKKINEVYHCSQEDCCDILSALDSILENL